MKVKAFFSADYVSIDALGKLNIIGAFSQIRAQAYPYTHYSMHALIILDAETDETSGNKELKLHIVSEAGEEIREISENYEFPPQSVGEVKEMFLVFSIRDLEFPQPGKYEFNLYIENQRMASRQLDLVQLDEQRA